jgi:hypothetical protein
MPIARSLVTVGLLAVTGGLAGCGNGSTSASSGAPTDASKASFCASFDKLTAHVSPKKAADTLARVGTPGDIGGDARRGFEVLLDRLRRLPEHANKGDITQMAKGLTGADQADVTAFISYYASECQGLPTGAPS